MQFSDIIGQTALCRMAPNSSFFLYYDSKKIYIKEASVALANFAVIAVPAPPSDIAISPNSELIAVFFKDKAIAVVYNLQGTMVAKIEQTQAGMSGILWAPDSVQLLIFSQFLYKVTIFNLTDKTLSMIRSPKLFTSKGCAFSRNGKLMALLQKHDCKDVLGIYHCGDWKMVNSIVMDSFDLIEVRWQRNDSHIVAWENPINYRFYAVCPFKGIVLRYQPYDYAMGVKSVHLSHTSYFVAVGSFDEKIRLLNAKTWKLISQLDCSQAIIQKDSTKIYKEEEGKGKGSHPLNLVDRTHYKIPSIKPQLSDKSAPQQGIGLLEFSPDDNYLACRNDNMPYTVWIWNVSTLELESVISLNSQVKMIRWDKHDNILCIAAGTDKVLFWNNGKILECSFQMQNRNFNIQKFIWSEDRKRMLLFDKAEVMYADLVNLDC